MIQEQPYKNDAFHENYVDREEELLHSPWAHHSLSQHFHVLTNWEALHLSFWVFTEASLHRQDQLHQWPRVIELSLQPLSPPQRWRRWGGRWG